MINSSPINTTPINSAGATTLIIDVRPVLVGYVYPLVIVWLRGALGERICVPNALRRAIIRAADRVIVAAKGRDRC